MPSEGDVPAEFLWIVVGDEDYHPTRDEMDEWMREFHDTLGHLDLDMIMTTHDVRPANVPEMDAFAELVAEKVIEQMNDDQVVL